MFLPTRRSVPPATWRSSTAGSTRRHPRWRRSWPPCSTPDPMLNSPLGVWLKRRFDSNDFAWTFPLPPWSPSRERQVRHIRIVARSVMRRRLVADRGWLYVLTSSCAWPCVALIKAMVAERISVGPRPLGILGRWWLEVAHNLGIGDQQYFRLERPEQRAQARLFVTDSENKAL